MSKSAVRRVRSLRPSMESLEGRALLSTVHLTVNTLADDPNGSLAGQTTLRDAITAADAGSAADKFVIKFAVDGTIALAAPLPALTGNIAIKGPGSQNLTIKSTIHGGPEAPYTFVVGSNEEFSNSILPTVDISGITIANDPDLVEGGIFNIGDLTATNCVFTGNGGAAGIYASARNGTGGAICNDTSAIISGCTFDDNAALSGGAVGSNDNSSTILTRDTFSDNWAVDGGAVASHAAMNVSGCIFSGNTATEGFGGAISSGLGVLNVKNSVFVDNSSTAQPEGSGPGETNTAYAGGAGGAIVMFSLNQNPGTYGYGFLTCTGDTFVGNSAPYGSAVASISGYFGLPGYTDGTANESVTHCIFIEDIGSPSIYGSGINTHDVFVGEPSTIA